MSSFPPLPIDRILDSGPVSRGARVIGASREGRPITGFVCGNGTLRVSLIAGCHADEPVGPATLERLAAYLASIDSGHPLLGEATWRLVSHVNPDGRQRNRRWSRSTVALRDHRARGDSGYRLDAYLRHVRRELPGDDIEFGFPRGADDDGARPENRAVADFLAAGAPYDLHGSFHGMGFSPGPWFLIEPGWISRTLRLRERIRGHVRAMGYSLFDPDRKGEKGFSRIDPGFCTRPDSRAMRDFFEARGDPDTAAKFRPSSMELIRDLGGDPFTFVSELPLFLTPFELEGSPVGILELGLLRARLDEALAGVGTAAEVALGIGINPMPIRDQQRLQLTLLDEALGVIGDSR